MAMAAMMPMITTTISPSAATTATTMSTVDVRFLAAAATPWPQLGQTGTPGFSWAPHREQNMSSSGRGRELAYRRAVARARTAGSVHGAARRRADRDDAARVRAERADTGRVHRHRLRHHRERGQAGRGKAGRRHRLARVEPQHVARLGNVEDDLRREERARRRVRPQALRGSGRSQAVRNVVVPGVGTLVRGLGRDDRAQVADGA